MLDRQSVIKGLEDIVEFFGIMAILEQSCNELKQDAENAITLLKEQEPIAPSICGSKEPDGHGSWWYLCGKCKKPIDYKDRFCKRCGQAVKWDE